MGVFEDITIRSNADDVDAAWWNSIRTALIQAFGGTTGTSSDFTIANNQTSYANVTGLLLDSSTYTSYQIEYRIERSTDSPLYYDEVGVLTAYYDGTNWAFKRAVDYGNALGDGSELGDYGTDYLYVVPGTGQVQYKSSNMAGGSYSGVMTWKITRALAA